jgi:glycosyltransferase involved in cell wall biosynthesis
LSTNPIKILAVCAWPLGGIRTYLGSVFRLFRSSDFEITILARETEERAALEQDLQNTPVVLKWMPSGPNSQPDFLSFAWHVAKELSRNSYDLINSHGFISGICASCANSISGLPHVLTIHGILEDRHYQGRLAVFRKMLFLCALRNVSVFHGVGYDILSNIRDSISDKVSRRATWITIPNGIDTTRIKICDDSFRRALRRDLGIDDSVPLFGFFGRFMPQKGFDLVIHAVRSLQTHTGSGHRGPVVLAVGSGDFERETRAEIHSAGLSNFFRLIPFRADIADLVAGCDAVLMPSRWEAFSLLAAECLCAGVPLIASNCLGLREVISGTPALAIPPEDVPALTEAMKRVQADPVSIRERALHYRLKAVERFDVRNTTSQLMSLFQVLAKSSP